MTTLNLVAGGGHILGRDLRQEIGELRSLIIIGLNLSRYVLCCGKTLMGTGF